jgi:hypothetical protein
MNEAEVKEYRYQPTFPEGHELAGQAMGGEQVIQYDGTPENLAQKLVENNNRMQAEMRRMKTTHAIEPQPDDEALPAGAMTRDKATFKRQDLSPADRVRLAKMMANPETIQEAYDELSGKRTGTNEDFQNLSQLQIRQIEVQAGARFGREHPEMVNQPADSEYKSPYGHVWKVPRDVAALFLWCDKRNLYHTYENLVLAWERLKKAGLLSDAPIAAGQDPAKSQPGADPAPGADSSEAEAQPTTRRVPTSSALNNRNSTSGNRQPVLSSGPTWQDIESLSAQQLAAKPADWKKAALVIVKRLPADKVNALSKAQLAKIDALA